MIKITDTFYIDATSECYILKEKTIIQDENSKDFGKETYKVDGYYTRIEDCLKGFGKVNARKFIKKEQENTMQDLIKEIHRINKIIEKFDLKGI